MKIKDFPKVNRWIKKLNRIFILIIAIEILYLTFFFFKIYRKKTEPANKVRTEIEQCLQEGRRYTIDEAIQEPRACNVEISSDEDVSKLSTASKKLTNVQSIYFRNTQNTNLPKEIGKLNNLTVLNFHHTFNTSLPPEIGKLKNLTVLKINKADIKTVPPEIGNLESLTSLIIINNAIKITLPSEIEKLKNLETLDLSNNNLTKIPEGIAGLTKLKYLNLSGNKLNPSDIDNVIVLLPDTQIVY